MNPWQMAQQIRHVLQRVTWDAGAREPVFGVHSVHLYTGNPDPEVLPAGLPLALITIDDATPDETHPELLTQNFTVATVVEVAGDVLGSHAVIGGARPDLGRSAGAGAAEVSERVRDAVQNLDGYDGARIVVTGSGMGAPSMLEHRHVVFDSFRVSAVCVSQPVYTAPQELRVAGGVARWTGAHCTARFDFLQFRMGYTAGETPAASPDDLDAVVYTGADLEAVVPSGTFRVVSVFADYDPRGTTSPAASSPADVGSWVAQ